MLLDETDLLLVRPGDLVVLGLRCRGFVVQGAAMRAGPGATIEIVLGPQATAEAATGPVAPAQVSGPSRMTFAVPEGDEVPLTTEGVLGALGLPESGDLELPYGLHVAPASRGGPLVATAPAGTLPGTGGALGLWQLRLESAGGLALVPTGVEEDGAVVPPLDALERGRVALEARDSGVAPTAPWLDLGALGGTVAVSGAWPTFSWDHRIVLGRDMAVQTTMRGSLYPFGHDAVVVDTTERVIEGDPPAAVLRTVRTLLITDAVRGPAPDPAHARAFPFDEVEMLTRAVTLREVEPVVVRAREPKRLSELEAQLVADSAELQAGRDGIPALFEDLRQRVRDDCDQQIAGASLSSDDAQALADLEAAKAAFDEWARREPVEKPPPDPVFLGPDGTDPPVFLGPDGG